MREFIKSADRHRVALIATVLSCTVFVMLGLPFWVSFVFIAIAVVWAVEETLHNIKHEQQIKHQQEKDILRSVATLNQLHGDISGQILQSLDKPQHEIPLLRELVSNSTSQLDKSFNGLNENARAQGEILLELLEKMSTKNQGAGTGDEDSQSLKEFASEMRKIIEYFIEQVLTTSHESMTMVHKIDDLVVQMQEVEELVGDVRTIADQTNLLALNAAIEAARAGEAGRGFAVVADEVRKLSQHSNDFSDQISGVVDKALGNINEAKDIIGKMASKDMSLAISSKSRVDNMLEDVDRLNEFLSEKLNHASAITESIAENVNLAVMSLQFEDVARQVTEHLCHHLKDSTDFVNSMREHYANILKDIYQPAHMEEKIVGLQNTLRSYEEESERKWQTRVSAAQEGQGDVDLF